MIGSSKTFPFTTDNIHGFERLQVLYMGCKIASISCYHKDNDDMTLAFKLKCIVLKYCTVLYTSKSLYYMDLKRRSLYTMVENL